MLITHKDIAELIREEGLKFYLISTVLEGGNPALGIPARKSESSRLIYGTLKPPKLDGIDTAQSISKQGEMLVYFPAKTLARNQLISAQMEYCNHRWSCQYIAEVMHRGVILMHLVKLVASKEVR